MIDSENFGNIILLVISGLISIIIYLSKLGIDELKQMRKEITDHKNDLVILDTKVENLDKRVTNLEK